MSFWMDRSVFVTGGTGLVGGWLVDRLIVLGARVTCLVRHWTPDSRLLSKHGKTFESVVSVRGDVVDTDLLTSVLVEEEVQTVFHLAAQAIVPIANRHAASTFVTNVGGTNALCEAALRTRGGVEEIIIASSDKAYGTAEELPYSEDTPLRGLFPYDCSKACADLIAQSYAHSFGLPIAITRCGNIYGGGDHNWSRIVPGTIRSLLRRESPVVRSNGRSKRDYFYVEDAAQAYIKLAEKLHEKRSLAGRAFNFSYEQPLDVLGMVARIQQRMKTDIAPAVQDHAPSEIVDQWLSAKRAVAELDWKPLYGLDAGLDATIQWYRQEERGLWPVKERGR